MSDKKIGFIPLRKNSKGIPNKNKKKLLGRPLFSWVLTEALFSNLDEIVVFTDDEEILDYVGRHYSWSSKVLAIKRSYENAKDTSSTEDAILEYCESATSDFGFFCLLQATSPLTKRIHINEALESLQGGQLDSILSVVNTHRFIWSKEGMPLNYEVDKRPRRQDFEGLLIENGAIYCTTKKALSVSKNRLSGKIGTYEMPEETLVEIDSETDWKLIEQLLITQFKSKRPPQRINHLVLDVDGVFTDGQVQYTKDGEFAKTFDMRDGMGLEILRKHGIQVWVITSESSEVVRQRMKKLNIDDVFLGIKDKFALLEKICLEHGIALSEIAYLADDVNDLANMLRAGWSFSPANATKTISFHADIVLNHRSANGAIREACEFLINYNLRFNGL